MQGVINSAGTQLYDIESNKHNNNVAHYNNNKNNKNEENSFL